MGNLQNEQIKQEEFQEELSNQTIYYGVKANISNLNQYLYSSNEVKDIISATNIIEFIERILGHIIIEDIKKNNVDINPLKFIDFKDGDMHFSFFNSLAKEFSTPVEPENGYKYIVTQVISDIFREMGFDGVLFNSSVGNGYNLVVFYTGKCSYVADSSKLYLIPKVKYDIFEMKYRFKKEHLFDFEPDVDLIPVENELVMSCPVGYMLSTN